jgi:tetratricopeptide (TPR) repeat protein
MSKPKIRKPSTGSVATPAKPAFKLPLVWQLGGILLLTLLLYLPSVLQNDFVMYDDDKGILINENIRDLSPGGLQKMFSSYNLGMYAPLSTFAYAVIYQLGELSPTAFHFGSLLLHLANILLIFKVFQRLTDRTDVSVVIALLFAIHPFQAEAVCWAAAMSVPLYAFFYLLALLLFLKFREGRNWLLYVASLALFLLSLLSKSAAVTLPPLLVLIDYFQGRKWLSPAALLEKAPFFLLALGFGVLTFISRDAEMHGLAVANEQYSLPDRFFMVTQTLLFYVLKLIFPVKLSLNYPFVKENGLWPVTYYLAPLVIAAIGFAIYKSRSFKKEWTFGLLFFLISLSVMLPFVSVGTFELRSDRYNYLAMTGIFFLAAFFYARFAQNKSSKMLATSVLVLFVVIFSATTFARSKVWKDGNTLFANLAESQPDLPLAHFNLGMGYLNNKQEALAIQEFTKALQKDPNYKRAYEKRGHAFLNLGDYAKAMKDLEIARSFDPNDVVVNYRLGQAYAGSGNAAKAVEYYSKAIELDPQTTDWRYARGLAYHNAGQTDQAVADYNKVLEINPQHAETLTNLGNVYAAQSDFQKGIEYYSKALQANPKLANAWSNRGGAYLQLNDYQRALEDFNQSVTVNPNYAKAYVGRAAAYRGLGRNAEADADMTKAAQLQQGQ